MGIVYRQPGRGRKTWMMKGSVRGNPFCLSTGATTEEDALKVLHDKETDLRRGAPVKVGQIRFEAAAADLLTDYETNDRRSYTTVKRRIDLHLTPFFRRMKMADIQTPDVKTYRQERRRAGASAATINRELALLKRMFTLAVQGRRLISLPYIPITEEHNVRAGFFELEAFESVRAHLPEALRGVMTVAYITGWRIDSEILPLEWRQVDFAAGTVALDAETTKNGKARLFPFTAELRAVFEAQHAARQAVLASGHLCPWVFFRLVAKGRGGKKYPKVITRFNKAWATACKQAGCPGRIPHDFRRTAVRNMVRRGVPERVAMQLTGHQTRSVFDRYNIVSPGDLTAAAARLEGLTAPPATEAASGLRGWR